MKIGILTWFCGMNYGAQAQCYALRNYLIENGHECEEIAYYPSKVIIKNIKMNLNIEPFWYFHPKQMICSIMRIFNFYKFILTQKKGKKVTRNRQIDSMGYDLIIIGSDEVINCIHPFNEKIYFGVGIEKTPIAYYAPSCGALPIDYQLDSDVCNSLNVFVALSARDKHTCEFLKYNVNRVVEQVVDPTLLYDFKKLYIDMEYKNYVLLYSFDSFDQYQEIICSYAKKNSKKIISVGRQCNWAFRSFAYATMEEWFTLFSKADIVITDSFHGLIFSIKNTKEFVLIGRNDKLNKINCLLEELEIQRGFIESSQTIESYLTNNPINYNKINKVLEKRIMQSKNFINEVIGGIK